MARTYERNFEASECIGICRSGGASDEGESIAAGLCDRGRTLTTLAFVLFAFTLPFEAVNLGQWSRVATVEGESPFVSLPKIVGFLFFLVTLADRKRCYALVPNAFWFFSSYFVLFGLWGLLGDYAGESVNRTASRVQMMVLLYASFNLLKRDSTRTAVFLSFGVSCTLLAALALTGVLGDAMIQTTDSGTIERVTGLAEDANTVAAILSLGVLSLVSLVITGSRVPWLARGLGGMAVLCLVSGIVRTGSRGGMLALAAGLLAFAAGERSRVKMMRNVLVVTAAAGCLALCLLSWESALTRWQTTLYDGNTAGRDIIMMETCKLIQERPLFGWGPVTADRALGAALGLATRGTHNLWLGVLLESGVVGTLLYGIGVALCVRAAWHARHGAAGVMPLALVTVVMVANLSLVWHNQKAHWLVLALALASGQRAGSWATKAKSVACEWLATKGGCSHEPGTEFRLSDRRSVKYCPSELRGGC
jgi:O-antigen ligase